MHESEEIVKEIMARQEAISLRRLDWEAAKRDVKEAKKDYESACNALNTYIAGLKETPLFDQATED